MKIPRPRIILENLQVKSLEKAQRLAAAIGVIEAECGIHEVEVTVRGNFFVCPWIDLTKLDNGPEEKLLRDLLIRYDIKRHGKESQYKKLEE